MQCKLGLVLRPLRGVVVANLSVLLLRLRAGVLLVVALVLSGAAVVLLVSALVLRLKAVVRHLVEPLLRRAAVFRDLAALLLRLGAGVALAFPICRRARVRNVLVLVLFGSTVVILSSALFLV